MSVSAMKILVSGSHGLVGSALMDSLKGDGHELFALVRRAPRSDAEVEWYPERESLALARLEGMERVIHLAGASIASGRWTEKKKQRIRDSRVKGTTLLSEALANLSHPPRAFLCASAIGFYGNRGDEVLTEESAPGNDFLAGISKDWETEALRTEEFRTRVVIARFGIILAKNGGALPKMMLPFEFGAGGRVGSGKQWMSWVALEDVIEIIRFALNNRELRGAVNVVAPEPVTNAEFTKQLARAMHRPALFPAPAFALRLALGEMADALLLTSQRVVPGLLTKVGYRFLDPSLGPALKKLSE